MKDLNEYCVECGVCLTFMSLFGIPLIIISRRYKDGKLCL